MAHWHIGDLEAFGIFGDIIVEIVDSAVGDLVTAFTASLLRGASELYLALSDWRTCILMALQNALLFSELYEIKVISDVFLYTESKFNLRYCIPRQIFEMFSPQILKRPVFLDIERERGQKSK